MSFKLIPKWVTMKVDEPNELPEHSFIYFVAHAGPEEVKALIFQPASEDDAIKSAAADLAFHVAKARLK